MWFVRRQCDVLEAMASITTCRRCNVTDSNALENQQLGAGKPCFRPITASINVCSAPIFVSKINMRRGDPSSRLRLSTRSPRSLNERQRAKMWSPKRERIWICTPRSHMHTHAERVTGWSPASGRARLLVRGDVPSSANRKGEKKRPVHAPVKRVPSLYPV